MKNILTTVLSLAAVFTLFIGSPANTAQASEVNSAVELQQESKVVTVKDLPFGQSLPPHQYFFNDGYYQGYISRISYEYKNGQYYGTYAGTVYRNGAPIGQVVEEF